MVYGGKPSTGCHLCRKRKIKCDEGHPECRNCKVYGKPCPGYRQDTVFRNETRKVERLVKKKSPDVQVRQSEVPPSDVQQPAPDGDLIVFSAQEPVTPTRATSLPDSIGSACSSSSRNSCNLAEPSGLSLYRVADTTWEERAVCYFFDQYTTFDGSPIGVSHLGFLPDLYAICREQEDQGQEGPASACLRRAVDAAALMTLGNATKAQHLAIQARDRYGLALRGLRQALESRTQAVKDETLASLAILSMFEDIAGERNGLYSSHRVGFEMLMKLRGASQLEHQQGRDLFSFAYTHTHGEILALGDKPRFNTDWILKTLDKTDPIHRLISMAARVCQIFLDVSSTESSPLSEDGLKLFTWIETGKQLDQELSEWPQNLAPEWLPLVVHSPTTGDPLITFQALFLSVVWNYYRAVRIILQRIMLELRTIRALFLGPFPDDAQVLEVIQDTIADVCRNIPYSLGDIDSLGNPTPQPSSPLLSEGRKPRIRAFHGYSLMWPLWYVLSCGMATPEQVELIRGALVRLGTMLGIKLAFRLAESSPEQFEYSPMPMGYPF